jgi:hypothetical protein
MAYLDGRIYDEPWVELNNNGCNLASKPIIFAVLWYWVFPYRTRYAFLVRLPKPGIPAVVSAVPILISQLGLREGCLFQVQFFLFDGL